MCGLTQTIRSTGRPPDEIDLRRNPIDRRILGNAIQVVGPLTTRADSLPLDEYQVGSNDLARRAGEGFLYFVVRRDELIEHPGPRIGRTEVQMLDNSTGVVGDAGAVEVPHDPVGQSTGLVALPPAGGNANADTLLAALPRRLWSCIIPRVTLFRAEQPKSPMKALIVRAIVRNWPLATPTSNILPRRGALSRKVY